MIPEPSLDRHILGVQSSERAGRHVRDGADLFSVTAWSDRPDFSVTYALFGSPFAEVSWPLEVKTWRGRGWGAAGAGAVPCLPEAGPCGRSTQSLFQQLSIATLPMDSILSQRNRAHESMVKFCVWKDSCRIRNEAGVGRRGTPPEWDSVCSLLGVWSQGATGSWLESPVPLGIPPPSS